MRTVALETSSLVASVALLDGDQLLRQIELDPQQRTARSLAPALAAQLQAAGWQPGDIQLVAVTLGPGSFTGLRLGVTTAKVLAYAAGADVIGLNTLDVIAEQAPHALPALSAVIDAHRQEFFTKTFRREAGGRLKSLQETTIVPIDQWIGGLRAEWAVTGPGLSGVRARIPPHVPVVDPSVWTPRAATVGRLAADEYRAGRRDDLWRLAPNYYRRSAAEEKRRRAD